MSDQPSPTRLLTRSDVRRLLPLSDCIDAVETAFRRSAAAQDPPARLLGLHVPGGGLHVKAAVMGDRIAAKLNFNFPRNPERGLPTIQGVVVLSDAADGRVLAIMDSMEITLLRTAAATALATRHLARRDAAVATVCGCGAQGAAQLAAVIAARTITRVFAHDRDHATAVRFACERTQALGIAVEATRDLAGAARQSDIVVTCTSSRTPLLGPADVRAGTFIAAVGADSEDKQEIEPALLAAATLVVDSLEQCATIGDLHHALAAGLLTRGAVHAELGQVVAGMRPGRTSADEITVFDSTGTALQDVAAAAMVYERACAAAAGAAIDLSA
jgi:ornithine cyclodeaminase/alanine dehydrogenase-like protein (mu-crystallin family)